MNENPVGLEGIEFVEFASTPNKNLDPIFTSFGFEKVGHNEKKAVDLYRQGDINFLYNHNAQSFAGHFCELHGPCISAMGWRVKNAKQAFQEAVSRGAKPYDGDRSILLFDLPTIYGIGDSLIYFVDQYGDSNIYNDSYAMTKKEVKGKGYIRVDHLTNNVPKGEMQKWCDFYEKVFNFKEKRFFDIKGKKTGLISKVMVSPGHKICIPINEPTEGKSQIQEYIDEYKGSGIQHLALLTWDIISSVDVTKKDGIEFLDTPDTYYTMISERGINVTEPIDRLKELKILVDGDEKGYLLQIFTKNLMGPIFFEVIQRKNHDGFGDGNFQALFDAIERDQMVRGVL